MTTDAGRNVAAETLEGGVVELKQEGTYGQSLTQLAMRRLRRDYLTLASFAVLALMTVLAVSAPLFESALDVSYRSTTPANKYQGIGDEVHPLGTDHLGRDHLTRLLYGGRVSLAIGFGAASMSLIVGMTLGVVAGFYQGGAIGIVDDAMMWFITTLNSIPQLFLLIIVASVLPASLDPSARVFALVLLLAFISWTGTMRLVRGETLSRRERDYVMAARASGASALRIMYKHILPNIFSILVVQLAINIGVLILVEAALSFLALGVQEPIPSWGNMLVRSQTYFFEAPHLAIIPGVLITVTVLCLFLIGDGLRDAFDPQANKK